MINFHYGLYQWEVMVRIFSITTLASRLEIIFNYANVIVSTPVASKISF